MSVKGTHKLYPIVEMVRGVPFRMGNSVYTLPEVPTIGFVRGRTSPSVGMRDISAEMGWSLNNSYARTSSISPSFRSTDK